jgi:2-polyprenyl-3-methyl-5-hydroxy-6-metoxy-1,4-benzoquinol methylase
MRRGRVILGFLNRTRNVLERRSGKTKRDLFQPYNYTLPDRYPWLFRFAAGELNTRTRPRILSFGCSRGDEVFALRTYLPGADIKGIDIDPRNIAECRRRAGADPGSLRFEVAATTSNEADESYDAIFCLAVLVHGDLAAKRAKRSDPLIRFADFERIVTDLARCLKPGGLLFLHTTNFRFSDTAVANAFDPVLEAEPEHMSVDPKFDRNDKLMRNVAYRAVAFRKR